MTDTIEQGADDVQTITAPGGQEMVVMPKLDYEVLSSAVEKLRVELEHLRNAGGQPVVSEEMFPDDFFKRLMLGDEHPLKVWREYRGFTQADLAMQAGVRLPTISEIENGKTIGTVSVLLKLSRVLGCTIELLLPDTE